MLGMMEILFVCYARKSLKLISSIFTLHSRAFLSTIFIYILFSMMNFHFQYWKYFTFFAISIQSFFNLFLHNNMNNINESWKEKKSWNGKIIEIAHSWIACLLILVELRFIKRIHMIEKQTTRAASRTWGMGNDHNLKKKNETKRRKAFLLRFRRSSTFFAFRFFPPPVSSHPTPEKNPSTTFSSIYSLLNH